MAKYGASVFGGPADPGTGSQGYRGDNLNKKWKSFAELSNNPQAGTGADFSALGNLKYGTKVKVTNPHTGKSLVLTKRDVGAGGGAVNGKKRGIDLWYKAGQYLGINGTGVVDVKVLTGKHKGATMRQGGGEQAPQQAQQGSSDALTSLLKGSVAAPSADTALTGTNIAKALLSAAESGGATEPAVRPAGRVRGKDGKLDKILFRADRIESRQDPYLWGGGHGAGSAAALKHYTGPLDCSGAVSKVLGIDPRVASQFKTIGHAGARHDRVTIYARDDHVLMYIPGRGLFGTSGSNRGGGAGYIKMSELPAGYLKNFTARHL